LAVIGGKVLFPARGKSNMPPMRVADDADYRDLDGALRQ